MRLAIISDWQKGLPYFCEELGIAAYYIVRMEGWCNSPSRLRTGSAGVDWCYPVLDDANGARGGARVAIDHQESLAVGEYVVRMYDQ
jgi:hypothetical protein